MDEDENCGSFQKQGTGFWKNEVLLWWAGSCSVNLYSNFQLMGGTVFPPYSLASGQGYGKGKSSIGDLLQKDLGQQATSSRTVVISASDPAAGHC